MKQTYIVLAPVTPKGKFKVCASRIGGGTKCLRYYEIAECPTEAAAETVRAALELAGLRVLQPAEQKAKAA